MEEGAGLGFGERVEDLLSSDWAIGLALGGKCVACFSREYSLSLSFIHELKLEFKWTNWGDLNLEISIVQAWDTGSRIVG